MMNKLTIKRWEVYRVAFGEPKDAEIKKVRPCLVLPNNWLNEFNSRVIIIPLTSQPVPFAFFHLKANFMNKEATFLPEQIHSISKKRVKGYLGEVSKEIIKQICELLNIICELEENYES